MNRHHRRLFNKIAQQHSIVFTPWSSISQRTIHLHKNSFPEQQQQQQKQQYQRNKNNSNNSQHRFYQHQKRWYYDHNKSDWEKYWKGRPGGKLVNLRKLSPAEIIIAINVLVFFLMGDSRSLRNSFTVSMKNISEAKIWTMLTYAFVHDNFMHLLFNCIALYSIRDLNQLIGNKGFLQLYFVAAVCSACTFLIQFTIQHQMSQGVRERMLQFNSSIVGASGAICGLFTYFALCYPYSRILIMFVLPVPALTAVKGFAIFEAFRLFFNVSPYFSASGHLGGIMGGCLFYALTRGRGLRL
jgi:membrane associated rhomboid family serine protease